MKKVDIAGWKEFLDGKKKEGEFKIERRLPRPTSPHSVRWRIYGGSPLPPYYNEIKDDDEIKEDVKLSAEECVELLDKKLKTIVL